MATRKRIVLTPAGGGAPLRIAVFADGGMSFVGSMLPFMPSAMMALFIWKWNALFQLMKEHTKWKTQW